VRAVAQRPEFARILGATPHALRRGGISLRLRTEDPQIVASECGTSLKMLSDHYSFPIEDLLFRVRFAIGIWLLVVAGTVAAQAVIHDLLAVHLDLPVRDQPALVKRPLSAAARTIG
jgi:hypothetical protein